MIEANDNVIHSQNNLFNFRSMQFTAVQGQVWRKHKPNSPQNSYVISMCKQLPQMRQPQRFNHNWIQTVIRIIPRKFFIVQLLNTTSVHCVSYINNVLYNNYHCFIIYVSTTRPAWNNHFIIEIMFHNIRWRMRINEKGNEAVKN